MKTTDTTTTNDDGYDSPESSEEDVFANFHR